MAGKKGMHDRTFKDPAFRERIVKKIAMANIAEDLITYVKTGEGMGKDRAMVALGLLRKVLPDLASTELEDKREGYAMLLQRIAQAKQELTPSQPEPAQEQPSVH